MRKRTTAAAVWAGAIALVVCSPTASSQDALGDGSALDANQRVGSGGYNARRLPSTSEARLRNALVQGQLTRGQSFRQGPGYLGSTDFGADADELAFQDLGGFDQQSRLDRQFAFPAEATRGVRGLENLRMQMGLSANLSGVGRQPLRVTPGAAGASAVDGRGVPVDRRDLFQLLDGTLRSTSRFTTRGAETPTRLGTPFEQDGRALQVVASPLSGVRALPVQNSAFVGPVAEGQSQDIDRIVAQMMGGEPIDATADSVEDAADDVADGRIDRRIQPGASAGRVSGETLSRERLASALRVEAARAGIVPAVPAEADDPDAEGGGEAGPDAALDPNASTDARIDELMQDLSDRLGTGEPFDETGETGETSGQTTGGQDAVGDESEEISQAIELIRRSRVEVDRLSRLTDEQQTVFDEHLRKGEEYLEAGRWFDAEERFTAALSIRPSSLESEVGRINAQIGAGLFSSSALNLRTLFTNYPELTGVVYDERLRPRGDRLLRVRDRLLDLAGDDVQRARDAGLLLAYLGYQTDRPDDVNYGFNRIREINRMFGDDPSPLDQLLERVWRR